MKSILLSLLVFGLGVGLLIFSVFQIKDYNKKNKTYIETESIVVGYDEGDDDEKAIIVEYTIDGKTYRKTSNTYTTNPKRIGSKVRIKYNPNNPEDAIWSKDSTMIVLPLAGVLFTGVGIYALYDSIKSLRKGD